MKATKPPETRRGIREVMNLAMKRKDIISLAIGEPDFRTPQSIIEATKKSLDGGLTTYSQANGIPELRQALARKFKKENGIDASEDDIIVTCGSSEALFLATFSIMKHGEKTLIPNPGFMDYGEVVKLSNGTPVSIKLSPDDFSFDLDGFKNSVDSKTRILFINSPSNPTGTVMSKKELEEIADFVVDKNLFVFSDEVYEKYVYSGEKHYSIGSMNGMEDKVFTFNTFSKTYSMPGFRLGYCTGPSEVIKNMTELKFSVTVSSPSFLQHGALEALKISEEEIRKNVKIFDEKRKLAYRRLTEIGLESVEPKGAFYIFSKTLNGMGSQEFAQFLIDKAKVLVVPGNDFGSSGEGFVRISYATSKEKISQAMDNIEKSIKGL